MPEKAESALFGFMIYFKLKRLFFAPQVLIPLVQMIFFKKIIIYNIRN